MIAENKMVWGRRFVVCVLSLVMLGCDGRKVPELGYVSGAVTMDGKPLDGVTVNFHPFSKGKGQGRVAVGKTDSEGKYVLTYLEGIEGTKLGPNKVSIMTFWPDGEPGEGEFETIPVRYYGRDTTLEETVVEGNNTFDFKLTSQ